MLLRPVSGSSANAARVPFRGVGSTSADLAFRMICGGVLIASANAAHRVLHMVNRAAHRAFGMICGGMVLRAAM